MAPSINIFVFLLAIVWTVFLSQERIKPNTAEYAYSRF